MQAACATNLCVAYLEPEGERQVPNRGLCILVQQIGRHPRISRWRFCMPTEISLRAPPRKRTQPGRAVGIPFGRRSRSLPVAPIAAVASASSGTASRT